MTIVPFELKDEAPGSFGRNASNTHDELDRG
jgi:hypothetical protein